MAAGPADKHSSSTKRLSTMETEGPGSTLFQVFFLFLNGTHYEKR